MKMKHLFAILSAASALVNLSAHGAWQVWTAQDTERSLRDAPAAKTTSVSLGAAQNEWESFQILVRADAPVAGIDLVPGDLLGPKGAVLKAADAVLFRQHQFELAAPSSRNTNFVAGWYPDPLIPFKHPLTKQPLTQGRLKAVPFDLPANQTHGFWVDILVPGNAPAGTYRGAYRLTAAGQAPKEIPVEMIVWNFCLPDTPTMQTALGSPAERLHSYYAKRAKAGKDVEPKDWDAVEAQCSDELARHHINATPPAAWLTPQAQGHGAYGFSSVEQVEPLRKFVDAYHVNALAAPHPRTVVKDPDTERAKLHAWLKSFDDLAAQLKRPNVTFFVYLKDEPNDEEAYRYVQKWGKAIRAANSALKVMVVEQTKTQEPKWGDLNGAVDIWCPLFPLHDEPTAAQRRALGEKIWAYTALTQRNPTPWWEIDYPLLNYRVPAWISWRYNICGLLYWGGMCHWTGVEDPWSDPKTLDRRERSKGALYNGDGQLAYPGRTVGYDGIAPSLRMKALRDGIEDYEYLALLERASLGDQARKRVLPLAESWFQWEKNPARYREVRAQLAEMIVKGKGK